MKLVEVMETIPVISIPTWPILFIVAMFTYSIGAIIEESVIVSLGYVFLSASIASCILFYYSAYKQARYDENSYDSKGEF